MPADTFTRTPVAKPGYPTDLTPSDAPLAATGQLRSWIDAYGLATELHAPPGFREHTYATVWYPLVNAARRYVAERGEDHTSIAVVATALKQVIEEARPQAGGA